MKNLLKTSTVLFVFLFAFQVFGQATHHVPMTAEDQGVDIPSVGSSMFDKIFAHQKADGEVVHKLPFPLKDLMANLSISKDSKKLTVLHTMMPFSRSLQRPSGTNYDPLLNPRLVFTVKESEHSLERSKIFIGFVKKTDQLEVISYNDEAGRYEYQLVKNYSKNPEVFYVNRGKCLSCHQGQAPIFSVPGWQDTNTGIVGKLIAAKVGIEEGNSQLGRVKMAQALFGDIKSQDAVGNFDSLVRQGNDIALNERVWVVGCGESNVCRLGLLLKELASNSVSAKKYFELAKEVILKSKLAPQNVYSSFLSSHDLGAGEVLKKYEHQGDGDIYENTAKNPDAVLEIVGNIYKLEGRDNPANRRRRGFKSHELVPRRLAGFTFEDQMLLKSEVPDVEAIILKLFKDGSDIFEASAINKPRVMWAILDEARSVEANKFKKWLDMKTPKKVLFTGPTIPVFQTKELNIFSRYCQKCHGTNLQFPPQFLIGTEDEVIGKITKLKRKINYKLTKKLMPPDRRERLRLERSGDLKRLLDYLGALD